MNFNDPIHKARVYNKEVLLTRLKDFGSRDMDIQAEIFLGKKFFLVCKRFCLLKVVTVPAEWLGLIFSSYFWIMPYI